MVNSPAGIISNYTDEEVLAKKHLLANKYRCGGLITAEILGDEGCSQRAADGGFWKAMKRVVGYSRRDARQRFYQMIEESDPDYAHFLKCVSERLPDKYQYIAMRGCTKEQKDLFCSTYEKWQEWWTSLFEANSTNV